MCQVVEPSTATHCFRSLEQFQYATYKYQREIFFAPVPPSFMREFHSVNDILLQRGDLCENLFRFSTDFGSNYFKCAYSPSLQTLTVTLRDGPLFAENVTVCQVQINKHCAFGSSQTKFRLDNFFWKQDLVLNNLYDGGCQCPMLSLLESNGVLFEGTVQWSAEQTGNEIPQAILDEVNSLLAFEKGFVLYNTEVC